MFLDFYGDNLSLVVQCDIPFVWSFGGLNPA